MKAAPFEAVEVQHLKGGVPKSCYFNAAKHVLDNPSMCYILGVMFFHGIPIEHAWVATERGQHQEVTLYSLDGSYEYYTIAIVSHQELINATLRGGGEPPDLHALARYRAGR